MHRLAQTGRRNETGMRFRRPWPISNASNPLLSKARVAAIHTRSGNRYLTVNVAAMIWPTSPHSENRMAANAVSAALEKFRLCWAIVVSRSSFRRNQMTRAVMKKVIVLVMVSRFVGSSVIACPTSTAIAILIMKATVNPQKT